MRSINNFDEARKVLADFVPPAGLTAGNYTLERMRSLMDALGNPQDTYKVVHIAGTSGKTSTAYFMAALLHKAGKKVGLTISPHVDEVNERVQINLTPLNEAAYCRALSEFLELVETAALQPTYFELLVAFAFWEFARQGVDYAVIEVGLGGLLDATNVIGRSDKVCILADIGFDHTNILGNDLPSIANQKAGIILPGDIVVCYTQSAEVMTVFRDISTARKAALHEVVLPPELPTAAQLPSIQQRNWYLAYSTYKLIAERDGLSELTPESLLETGNTTIPARTEMISHHGKTIIFDGAHNGQKMQAAVGAVQERFTGKQVAVLVGMLEDKEVHLRSAMQKLAEVATIVIATSFSAQQDLPRHPLDPHHIEEICHEVEITDVIVCDQLQEAVRVLLARPEPVLFITGSFYLMHAVRSQINLHESTIRQNRIEPTASVKLQI